MIIEKIALRKKTIKRNIVKNKIKSSVLIELNIINFDVNVVALLFSRSKIEEIYVNGDITNKVSNILNISFAYVEGESLIMALKDIAVSSGSACTSASLEPSYVLRALGRADELAHSSIRFSFGRFTTPEEVKMVAETTKRVVRQLRELSPLWDMYLDGVDLDTVEWAHH